jgi:glycosyltransferase involved in cell wall biosynthesis
MSGRKIRVLCVANYFLPGYAGGGPIRSIANLAFSLPDYVQFDIFTRDHDLGTTKSYDSVKTDEWSTLKHRQVFYASRRMFSLAGLKAALRGKQYDLLYLNGLFGVQSSILPYLWNCFGNGPRLPVLIAPRGGLTLGALGTNPWRKRIFLLLARWSRIYRNVHWHASSELEAEDILRQFPEAQQRIHVAPDLVSSIAREASENTTPKVPGRLRLIFLSRISPMKNLLGLISFLSSAKGSIQFDIFGPMEDEQYWTECQAALKSLPQNIAVRYMGPVSPAEVGEIFSRYDLFALPTFGENFGHVVFEALQSGTPVLISDRTLWRDDPRGAITTVSLESPSDWTRKLDDHAALDAQKQETARQAAREYADRYLAEDGSLEKNEKMFKAISMERSPC